MSKKTGFSSGMDSLDEILDGIMPGDNIVWQVDNINDFIPTLDPYFDYINKNKEKLVYFRFANHAPFVPDHIPAIRYELNPHEGFEPFISKILNVIEEHGKGVYYIFDSLSDLAVDWYSDRMLGNFFMLTCPYLYIFDTVTYFVLLKDSHTSLAVNAIHNTAQVIIDVFHSGKNLYILPIKVWKRFSPTMYMLHSWEKGNKFKPVKSSVIVSEILSNVPQPWIDYSINRQDTWTSTFIQAQKIDENMCAIGKDVPNAKLKKQLIKMIITRDEALFPLCEKYFDICTLISIGKRLIGTGLIGGKSVGMLLARAILQKEDPKWIGLLETHDSFFIGSDVFYTYVIQNKCWWEKHHLKTSKDFLEKAKYIKEKLANGKFPQSIINQFKEILSYFGQAPIIVRSSSLLEDAYGNAFSGKYDSVFCANQGTPEERLEQFIDAVKVVYSSTMSDDALSYRSHRGLLEREEQMALLVQRVSGAFYSNMYYPQIAGVGYSFNPFVWNSKIDPKEGVIRLVLGLGTRAVDRHDDDYTRIIALNAPMMRPEGTFDEVKKYTQRIMDVLDLDKNAHVSASFEHVAKVSPDLPLDIFATKDREVEKKAKALKIKNVFPWFLTFEKLLTKTSFIKDMQLMLQTLAKAYDHPVDIEFAVNFLENEEYRINLLQCRPFQVGMEVKKIKPPKNLKENNIILKSNGPIIGETTSKKIHKVIYVKPSKYGYMSVSDKYSIARIIGELTNMKKKDENVLLIGPGRWGTKMPSLGIPVSFSEIRNVAGLCEVVAMHEGLTPDISLGTHFFNDLVEMNIVYMALFPEKKETILNEELITSQPNMLTKMIPNAKTWEDSIYVIDANKINKNSFISLYVNAFSQEAVLFSAKK